MNRVVDHYVSPEPFDPSSVERLSSEQERFYLASQWRMMWWKFRRHRLAVFSGAVLAVLYASILVSEFLAPYNLHSRHVDPQRERFGGEDNLKQPPGEELFDGLLERRDEPGVVGRCARF